MSSNCFQLPSPRHLLLFVLTGLIVAFTYAQQTAESLCDRFLSTPIEWAYPEDGQLYVKLANQQIIYSIPLTAEYVNTVHHRLALFNRSQVSPIRQLHLNVSSPEQQQSFSGFTFNKFTYRWILRTKSVIISGPTGPHRLPLSMRYHFVCDPVVWQTVEATRTMTANVTITSEETASTRGNITVETPNGADDNDEANSKAPGFPIDWVVLLIAAGFCALIVIVLAGAYNLATRAKVHKRKRTTSDQSRLPSPPKITSIFHQSSEGSKTDSISRLNRRAISSIMAQYSDKAVSSISDSRPARSMKAKIELSRKTKKSAESKLNKVPKQSQMSATKSKVKSASGGGGETAKSRFGYTTSTVLACPTIRSKTGKW